MAALPWIGAALGGLGTLGLTTKTGRNMLFGEKEKFQQKSRLDQQQQPLYRQLQAAAMNPGAGGAFGHQLITTEIF